MSLLNLVLIDDEPLALQQFKKIIERNDYGFQCVGAFSDSREALEFIKNNTVHAIITDIMMPDITGIDIAAYCDEHFPDIKIILVSAYRNFDYAKTAIKFKSVVDYILKPLTFAGIDNALQSIKKRLSSTDNFKFSSRNSIINMQQIISDILCGVIKDDNMLKAQLSAYNIPHDIINRPCALMRIQVNEFDSFSENTWKYDKSRLYNAISLLLNSSSEDADAYLICYSGYNLECMIMLKNSELNFTEFINSYKEMIAENFKNILELNITFEKCRIFSSMHKLILENYSTYENVFVNNNIIDKATRYIEENYQNDISLDDIANHVSLSKIYFCTYYKQHTGESFTSTLNRIRIEKAKELLLRSDITVSTLHELVGYKSLRYFYRVFKEHTGLTPNKYRALSGGVNHERIVQDGTEADS